MFFDTRLYAYLNASNPVSPLDRLSFRQNSTSAAWNADLLQEILTGNVTTQDWSTILGLLDQNAAGVALRQAIALGNHLLLYSLPDGAVRLVGYRPSLTGISVSYTFCTSGCAPPPPAPWWEQVWVGLIVVVTAILVDAIVITAAAFSAVTTLLNQVGNWFAQQVSNAVAAVKNAVAAAAKVLEQVVDWIVESAVQGIRAAIKGLVAAAQAVLAATVGGILDDVRLSVASPGGNPAAASSIAMRVQQIASYLSAIPIAIRGAEIVLAIATLGAGAVAAKLVSKTVVEFIIRTLAFTALMLTASVLLNEVLDSYLWVEDAAVKTLKGIGVAATLISGVGEVAFGLYKAFHESSLTHRTPLARWFAVGMALLSIFLVTAADVFNVRGPALFVADVLSVCVAWGGMMVYFLESGKTEQKAADLLSSLGVVFEQAVVFGSLPVSTGEMLLDAAEGKWG